MSWFFLFTIFIGVAYVSCIRGPSSSSAPYNELLDLGSSITLVHFQVRLKPSLKRRKEEFKILEKIALFSSVESCRLRLSGFLPKLFAKNIYRWLLQGTGSGIITKAALLSSPVGSRSEELDDPHEMSRLLASLCCWVAVLKIWTAIVLTNTINKYKYQILRSCLIR